AARRGACLRHPRPIERPRTSAGRGAAAELRANAEIDPGALALLPPALARIENRERRNAEAFGQRCECFGRRRSGGRRTGIVGVLAPERSGTVDRIEDAEKLGLAEAEHVEIELVLAQRRELGAEHRFI